MTVVAFDGDFIVRSFAIALDTPIGALALDAWRPSPAGAVRLYVATASGVEVTCRVLDTLSGEVAARWDAAL